MARLINLNFQFVFVSVIAVCARRKNLGQITGTKLREQRNGSETCRLGAHYGRGTKMFRSGRRNPVRRAECHLPSTTKQRKAETPARWRSAKSRPTWLA